MTRSIGAILAMTVLAVSCAAGGSAQLTGPQTAASSVGGPPEPILGTWRMEYTCEKLVRALTQVTLGDLARQTLVDVGLQKGPVDPAVGNADLCVGAKRFERTHVFRPNGYLTNYQNTTVADDCRCYMLVDDHTFVVLGDPGEPDIPLQYRIDGGTLTFEAVLPDQCTSATCRGGYAFAIAQYALGPWHRANA